MILSFITGAIGISLISSGTYAYFSDTVETTNTIESGTLELGLSDVEKDGVLFEFINRKPGDTFDYSFELTNDGTLDIGDVTLHSDYTVIDQDKVELKKSDFGSQIRITSLQVNNTELITKKRTLEDLKEISILKDFTPGETAQIDVEFEFMITEAEQNKYQGNAMELKWTFEAMQVTE